MDNTRGSIRAAVQRAAPYREQLSAEMRLLKRSLKRHWDERFKVLRYHLQRGFTPEVAEDRETAGLTEHGWHECTSDRNARLYGKLYRGGGARYLKESSMLSKLRRHKKQVTGILFPRYFYLLDMINHNALFSKWAKAHANIPYFEDRFELYAYLNSNVLRNRAIDFLEFGVFEGESLFKWAELNTDVSSRFFGFDSFHGLMEDFANEWFVYRKGHFTTHGRIPEAKDGRVTFVPGLFQVSLRPFLSAYRPGRQLVINVDCDLHSSTLYVLANLDYLLYDGAVVIFDEFSNPLHEFQAFHQYIAAFGKEYDVLAASGEYYSNVAVRLKSNRANQTPVRTVESGSLEKTALN
jgi:O-methyltransferase